MQIRTVITGLGGVARTHQLLETHTPGEIRASVERGDIARLRKGVYALSFHSLASHAARHGGRLTCISLLRDQEVWILSGDKRIHADLGRNGRRHHAHDGNLRAHNTCSSTALTPVTVAEALVLAAGCLTPEAFFAAFESAWNHGLLAKRDRDWVRAQVSPRLRRLLTRARGNAQSGLESLVRLRLSLLGFDVRSQVQIPTVGHVDALIDKVIIETDGDKGHADPKSRREDLRRDRAAAALGFQTIRLTYAMVVHDWAATEQAILAALAR